MDSTTPLTIDLIVVLRADHLPLLPDAYPAPRFYLPPAEVIAIEMARERRGHFNVIHSPAALKANLKLLDPFSQSLNELLPVRVVLEETIGFPFPVSNHADRNMANGSRMPDLQRLCHPRDASESSMMLRDPIGSHSLAFVVVRPGKY